MAAMNSDNFPHFQQLGDFFLPSIPTFLGGSVVSVFLFFFLLFFFFPWPLALYLRALVCTSGLFDVPYAVCAEQTSALLLIG